MEPGSFMQCPVTGQEATGMNLIQEIPFKHKKRLFYCDGGQTLEEVSQRGCGVSISRDV